MALRLLVLTAAVDPRPSVLMKGRRATLGRAADAHIRIPDPSVSPLHATIIKRGENFLLQDDSSTHGTGIASGPSDPPVWLAPDSPRVLSDGEVIWLGQIQLQVSFEASARGEPSGYEELPERLVTAGLLAAGLSPTPEFVARTLQELTDLPEEELVEPEAPPTAPLGVAALREDDEHPPWVTDLAIAGLALLILLGCAYGIYTLTV